jgi:thiol:disulfide interchange protein DsbC
MATRSLLAGEIALSQLIFGTSIDYSRVRIHNHSYLPFNLQHQHTAMAPNGHMYFLGHHYREDYSQESLQFKHWFIHEMTHVWQYQSGYPVKFRGALRLGLSYAYHLDSARQLCDYNMEAQGELLADYCCLKYLKTNRALAMKGYTTNDLPLYEAVLETFLIDPANRCHLPNTNSLLTNCLMNTFFKKTLIGLSLVGAFAAVGIVSTASVVAQASDQVVNHQQAESLIRKAVEDKIGNNIKVDEVRPSPLAGLYEVRLGNEIIYVDQTAEFLIAGNLQQLKTGKNYTQERIDALASAAVFSPENKANALKLVKGDGSRELVLFEDVNCGYCKKLRVELESINNVTIYTYLVPILSQDSENKMRAVWCAKDRNKTYDDWMLRGIAPVSTGEACQVPVDENQVLARSLRVQGTPAMFFSNGKRVPGYIKAEQIEQYLTAAAQK